MAENRFSIARSLCEFLEREGVACSLGHEPRGSTEASRGDLEIKAPGLDTKRLIVPLGEFCRRHDLHLVQFLEQLSTVRIVLAWRGEAGEPRFLAVLFRDSSFRLRSGPGVALRVLGRRALRVLRPWTLRVAFFGADEASRRAMKERVLGHLGSMLHGLRVTSFPGGQAAARKLRRRLRGPDLWVWLDVPANEEASGLRQKLEFADQPWNAAIVDATGRPPANGYAAEWAILRFLEGDLEFRHPGLQPEGNPLMARLLLRFCRRRTPLLTKILKTLLNCDIYCRIWSPLLLAHPFGIVIHAGTVIGRRVTIMQQVTLGAKDRGVHAAPVLEDDVYVGSGAKVLGAVHVGRGATIGANAVVTRDVPPHTTVVGANRIVRGEARGRQGGRAARGREAS